MSDERIRDLMLTARKLSNHCGWSDRFVPPDGMTAREWREPSVSVVDALTTEVAGVTGFTATVGQAFGSGRTVVAALEALVVNLREACRQRAEECERVAVQLRRVVAETE